MEDDFVALYSAKHGDLVTILSKSKTQRINSVTWSQDAETVSSEK